MDNKEGRKEKINNKNNRVRRIQRSIMSKHGKNVSKMEEMKMWKKNF